MALEIRTEAHDSARYIALSGRLDSDTSAQLESVVAPWLDDASVTRVVFNLKELKYISSAGLRVFFLVQKALEARSGSVIAGAMQPAVEKVFEIVKALPSFSIFRSMDEMDEYLDRMQKKVTGELVD